MSDVRAFLNDLAARGITLTVEGTTVLVNPAGRATGADVAFIRAQRAAILGALRPELEPDPSADVIGDDAIDDRGLAWLDLFVPATAAAVRRQLREHPVEVPAVPMFQGAATRVCRPMSLDEQMAEAGWAHTADTLARAREGRLYDDD